MLSGDRALLRPIERSDLRRPGSNTRTSRWRRRPNVARSSRPCASSTRPSSTNGFETNKDWVRFAIEVDGTVIGECDLHHIHQFTRSCELVMSVLREDWKLQT
jgi:RimJ/RimL family protein N-acetyltransferase